MEDKKEASQKVHFTIKKDFLSEIDDFAKEFRFTSRADAMRYLMASGLKYNEIASNLIKHRKNMKE